MGEQKIVGASSKDKNRILLTWALVSMGVHLAELRHFWARALGVSGTQWLILTALFELDQEGDGVPVNAVSKKTLVQSNFVTTQSKILEKKGLLRRRRSGDDARIVQLSLTDRAYKALATLSSRHESLNEFIFAELNERQLEELTNALTSLDNRFQKAGLKLLVGI